MKRWHKLCMKRGIRIFRNMKPFLLPLSFRHALPSETLSLGIKAACRELVQRLHSWKSGREDASNRPFAVFPDYLGKHLFVPFP